MILLLLAFEGEADRALLSDLFASNYHRMKRAAAEILREPNAAEDVVQDTFVRCIRRFDTLRGLPEAARAVYLLTATRRNALNRLRSSGRHPSVPAEDVELPDKTASVEERAIRSLTVAEVKDAFTKLPNSLKDVLRYKYLLELSDREIAKALGISTSTVRVYLTRARRAVLELCKENGYAEE
jgi:RNA polymerase sigma-70 factor (ECF subfamily)